MITVRIFTDKKRTRVTVTGHAGYNPGNDIVCAAMSTAVWFAGNMMGSCQDDGEKLVIEADIGSGKQKDACGLFEKFCCELSEQYPDYVKVVMMP